MFGYVTPLKGELKIKEFNLFNAYYCGVCLGIKKLYGNIPRGTLNYDMTFLALLLDGLSCNKLKIVPKRCMAHPHKKKPMILDNFAIDYASSMNVALVYYKLLDDVLDDNSIKSKFLTVVLKPYKDKFSSSLEDINLIIKENLNKLYQLEKDKDFSCLDEICHPFSEIVANILKLYPNPIENDTKIRREILYSLGYSLGKWIYLIDALDDLEDDLKNSKFNPINHLFNKDNLSYTELLPLIKARLEFSIFSCGANCKEKLLELNLHKNENILLNIIELGMADKYYKIFDNNCNCKDKKGSDFSHESI
ncbi:MAG: DUF5685 family protein [Clostridium sp.]